MRVRPPARTPPAPQLGTDLGGGAVPARAQWGPVHKTLTRRPAPRVHYLWTSLAAPGSAAAT